MPQEVSPNDLITFPENIPEALHGVVQVLWLREKDFLLLKLVLLQKPFDGSEAIKMTNHVVLAESRAFADQIRFLFASLRIDGGSNSNTTRRDPHRGHFIRLSSLAKGNVAPRVHTSVCRSSSAP